MTLVLDGWAVFIILLVFLAILALSLRGMYNLGQAEGKRDVLASWNNEVRTQLYTKEKS